MPQGGHNDNNNNNISDGDGFGRSVAKSDAIARLLERDHDDGLR